MIFTSLILSGYPSWTAKWTTKTLIAIDTHFGLLDGFTESLSAHVSGQGLATIRICAIFDVSMKATSGVSLND